MNERITQYLAFGIMILLCFGQQTSRAQLDVEVSVDQYSGDTLYLGYYYGDKKYFYDTAVIEKGNFHFENEESVPQGMYIVFDPQSRRFHDVMLGSDQKFSMKTDTSFRPEAVSFQGSKENTDFYNYIEFLGEVRPKVNQLQDQLPDPKIQKKLDSINESVEEKQEQLIDKHEGGLLELLIQNSREMEIPEFEGSEQEVHQKRLQYFKKHYFDELDLTDDRAMKMPFFHSKLETYMEKLTPKIPDSIIASLDLILQPFVEDNYDALRYYLPHYLNKYARSKTIGMDKVYVHLVDRYYNEGVADWTGEETLDRIREEADKKRTVLIGKTAPDIQLLTLPEEERIRLHEIESPYTVLFFWDPECSHCKKQTPDVIEFYEEFKEKGVKLVAVCTKLNKDAKGACMDYIKEREGMDMFINAYDPFLRSRYKQKYDVRTTPRVYILDEKKKILMKGIAGGQLKDVMLVLMENDNQIFKSK